MGKIKGHSLVKEVSGSIGKDLYVRKSGSNTIISGKGIVRQPASENQQAALHARGALMEPELSRTYKIIGMLQGINTKSAVINDFCKSLFKRLPSSTGIKRRGQAFKNKTYQLFLSVLPLHGTLLSYNYFRRCCSTPLSQLDNIKTSSG